MCGLWGFIVPKGAYGAKNCQSDKRNFIEQGLIVSSLRGMDGTGIASVLDPLKPPVVFKKAVDASTFIQLKGYNRTMQDADNAHAFLCHTRSSTKSAVLDENAHPFQYGHITLIHNGVVYNHKQLASDCMSDVDSAHFAKALSETKDEMELLKNVQGEYTFIWHNSKEGTINVVRNPKRPLYWARIPEWGNGYVFGSEYEGLAFILERNGIAIKDNFWFPKEHELWKIKLGKELVATSRPFAPNPSGGRRDHVVRPENGSTQERTIKQLAHPLEFMQNTHGLKTLTKECLDRLTLRVQNSSSDSSIPESERQVTKAIRKLDDIGLKFGRPYGIAPRAFIPYRKTPDVGCVIFEVEGIHHKMRAMQAELHGISRETWTKELLGANYILAKAVNVKNYNRERVVIMHLDSKLVGFDLAKEDKPRPMLQLIAENAKQEEVKKEAGASPRAAWQKREDEFLDDYERHLKDMVVGPEGEYISTEEFYKLTTHGCAHCTGFCNPEWADEMYWKDNSPICHVCSLDQDVVEELGLNDTHRAHVSH